MTDAPQAPQANGILLKVADPSARGFSAASGLGSFEEILRVPEQPGEGMGLAMGQPAVWVRLDTGENGWDRAHGAMVDRFAAEGSRVLAAEPDMVNSWAATGNAPGNCAAAGQKPDIGPTNPQFGWHLGDGFGRFAAARAQVPAADQQRVRVVHLDTGYDPNHHSRPKNILTDLERNFTGEGDPKSARDVTGSGIIPSSPGHGPGTIGLLAGGPSTDPAHPEHAGLGPIGGAPDVSVIPVRVANFVVQFTTSGVTKGYAYAAQIGCDLVTMSLGGLASGALADAINACYDKGIFLVSAGGNAFEGLPTPTSIVYPARMRRVIAATGLMGNRKPYRDLGFRKMVGCSGPDSKMATALAGWTPNVPWARRGCPDTIDEDGAGTSAATAQVAALAALWIARHYDELRRYPLAWMRAEAVRQALLASGRRNDLDMSDGDVRKYLGCGAVDAVAALATAPAAAAALVAAPRASAAWDWLRLITGQGVGIAVGAMGQREKMLALELMQIAQLDPALAEAVADPDAGTVAEADRKQFLEVARDSPIASRTLKVALTRALDGAAIAEPPRMPPIALRAGPAPVARTSARFPPPRRRKLRIYSLDPSLATDLDSQAVAFATVDVRFEAENGRSRLEPGPIGEYLEVIDVDPASDMMYPPVDLDHPSLLAQDGLTPSEGNPQFHQQMVYAVCMRTIESFEDALGRKAIWARKMLAGAGGRSRYEYVPRLRIYPHALRQQNAYYSPERVALLFGYFPSEADVRGETPQGTLVFSCLSADIVTHETTHALLDGYTPGYKEDSNPDVAAFHEGFSDIVALFHQFQLRDLVLAEIARARGDISAASLLGGIARQFGQGTGRAGPLRRYIKPDGQLDYETKTESHDRGALLVAAVYQAYQSAFAARSRDLIRLATGGSGVLKPGDIHPALAERLTIEACTLARSMLRSCIRALDFCPPSDIGFADYLRALVTADTENAPDVALGHRLAFLDSFRAFGMLPRDLSTISVETLKWSSPGDISPAWSPDPGAGWNGRAWLAKMLPKLEIDWLINRSRWNTYQMTRHRCAQFHLLLAAEIAADPDVAGHFGLSAGIPRYDGNGEVVDHPPGTCFEVRDVRPAKRARADGTIAYEIVVVLQQRQPEYLDPAEPTAGSFWFRGGATMVIDCCDPDSNSPELRYFIWKRLGSRDRLDRERIWRQGGTDGTRALYFGATRGAEIGSARPIDSEPFALIHAERY